MKFLLIAGLLAAFGSVAFASHSVAGNRYCSYYPEDPNCYEALYGQGGVYHEPHADTADQEFEDGNFYFEPALEPLVSSCEGVGRELRKFGYRNVRPVECGGSNYKYVAYLGYQRYLLKVNSRNGAIVYEINY
jgi:hypothetical protein